MATGDAALAAGMDILTGSELANTLDTEENKTRDYIAGFAAGVRSIAAGGTGAPTAAGARTNLDVVGNDQVLVSTSGAAIAGKIPRYDASGRLAAGSPAAANHVATRSYVDQEVSQKAEADALANVRAGELSQTVWNRDIGGTRRSVWMSAPSGGYIDLGWASSSRRKKENIADHDTTDEQVLAARLVSFDRIGGGPEVGGIAEEFDDAGFGWLVYRDEEGQVEGIEYSMIGIALLPVVQRLLRRVADLEQRLEEQ